MPSEVKLFETCAGGEIYQIPIEAFPGFWAYAYLVLFEDYQVLIDTGSGFNQSNNYLEDGFKQIRSISGRSIGLPDLSHIFITHGHIDHYGGLPYVRSKSNALVGIHELDLRKLTNTEERIAVVARRLDNFLLEAGVSDTRRNDLVQLYKMTKLDYQSDRVGFTYNAKGMKIGPFEMLHVPGHCAGQVVIRIHDVLFSGDHVLSEISPHQAPESLSQNTGLGHYLESLDKVRPWAEKTRITFGGHYAPIKDLTARMDSIQEIHNQRLTEVLEILSEPHTIVEISKELFGEVNGFTVLLALEESGAHIEYLYQRGLLGIANITEYENCNGCVPIRYYKLE